MSFNLVRYKLLHVRQLHELGEWIGFETRNKYAILDEQKQPVGYAAEQQKGILGFLLRQYLGHWRRFDIHFFLPNRQLALIGHHPFRWFFQRMEVREAGSGGRFLGAIQKRFSIFSKKFDLEDANGRVLLSVSSPLWRIWSFTFRHQGRDVATVKKRWSGLLSEALTDKDNFAVEYLDPTMGEDTRALVMVSAMFVDLLYFENKE